MRQDQHGEASQDLPLFEEENEAEYRRRAQMTPEERMQELAELRARYYGEDWAEKPMERVATWERVVQ